MNITPKKNNYSESLSLDDTKCVLGQHEHLRPADGCTQQHIQLHPHERPGTNVIKHYTPVGS